MFACWFLFHQTKQSCQFIHLQKYSFYTPPESYWIIFCAKVVSSCTVYFLWLKAGGGCVSAPLQSPFSHAHAGFCWGCFPVRTAAPLFCHSKSFSVFSLTWAPEEPSPASYPHRVVPFLCLLTALLLDGVALGYILSHIIIKLFFFLILSSSTRLRSLWNKACYILPTYHFRPKMDIPSCTQIRMFCSPLTSKCIMGQIYRLLQYFYSNYLMREEEKRMQQPGETCANLVILIFRAMFPHDDKDRDNK